MLPTFGLGWRPPTVHGTRLYRKNCPGSTDCASHAADGCTLPCSVSQVVPTVLRSYSGAVHVSRPVLMAGGSAGGLVLQELKLGPRDHTDRGGRGHSRPSRCQTATLPHSQGASHGARVGQAPVGWAGLLPTSGTVVPPLSELDFGRGLSSTSRQRKTRHETDGTRPCQR